MAINAQVPPHSVEAEQAVLAGVFLCPSKYQTLSAILSSDDFYQTEHRLIWSAMKLCQTERKPVDVVTVFDALVKMESLDQAGGSKYLSELTYAVVSGANADFYAQVVKEKSELRRAIDGCMRAISEAHAPMAKAGEVLDGLGKLARGRSGEVAGSISDIVDQVVTALESGSALKPLPTPWPRLNAVLKGGMVPGELVVLAARPGLGKTAMAGCLAVEVARSGKPVLFISREVKDTTLVSRFIAREARVDNRIFRQGVEFARGAELERVKFAGKKLAVLPLHVVEKSVAPMTPAEVRRLALGIDGLALVVVDYLQLLNPNTKHNNREREVAEMSRAMKELALECSCPVLLLSQLSRKAEETERPPILSDLRESGAIEQDADIVTFLHSKRTMQGMIDTPVRVEVAKGRSSGTGVAYMVFEKPYANFREDENQHAWAESNTVRGKADNGL